MRPYAYLADLDNMQKLAKRPDEEKVDWLRERIKRNLYCVGVVFTPLESPIPLESPALSNGVYRQ